jgi:hypothetical protein
MKCVLYPLACEYHSMHALLPLALWRLLLLAAGPMVRTLHVVAQLPTFASASLRLQMTTPCPCSTRYSQCKLLQLACVAVNMHEQSSAVTRIVCLLPVNLERLAVFT